ncbi:MAG: lipid II flippase MurJ [Actinomycetaceae bacterium]|nr:lipid II flippase MurJ [Actinomycetaceae bacterium]
MSEETTPGADEQPIGDPKKSSLLKSSAVMAVGTTLSRGLGFLRTALLLAALGAAGANDAFNVANTLPNAVFNLLAAGLLDAILVPQIVRAFKTKSGSTYVNRLLTLAGLILFVLTIAMVAAAGLLVNLTAGLMSPGWKSLAIVFAIWCLPQIFFYGIYSLLGQFLNARGIFGPYMWMPVANNVIAIIGLIIFIAVYGTASDVNDPSVWDFQRTALMAGPATLGVMAQALLLIIPLRRAGVKLRLDFHFRGTGLGKASKIAGWVFATLIVGQVGYLSTSNIAAAANAWSAESGIFAASTAAMGITFTVYMLPQSIISVSIATALFTRIASAAADGNQREMVRNYQLGIRSSLLLTMWLAAILGAAAIPIFQILGPTNPMEHMAAYADALVIMLPGLAGAVVILFSQRVFYSLEDGRPVFYTVLLPTIGQIILGWTLKIFFLPPVLWLAGALVAETISRIAQGLIATSLVKKRLPGAKPSVVIGDMLRYGALAVVSGLVGAGVLHFIGPFHIADSVTMRVIGGIARGAIVAVVVTIVYVTLLALFDRANFTRALGMAGTRIPPLRRFAPQPGAEVQRNRPEDPQG